MTDPRSAAKTVVQLISQVERRPGGTIAVENVDGSRRLNTRELVEASNRLANALIGRGLQPGDRVAYAAHNHLEYVVLEFALVKAGLVKVPLNPRFTPAELRRCLDLAGVRCVVSDVATALAIEEVLEGADIDKVVIGALPGWQSFDDLLRTGSSTRVQRSVAPDDLYHIRFSSGSTGAPKGIAISHQAARAAMLGNTWVMSSSGPVPRPRTLQVAPVVYAGGWSVVPTLLCGGTNIVMERFDADETIRAIADRGVTWMFAVPTMLRRLSGSRELASLRSSDLSCLMLAGEPAALPALEVVAEHTDALVQCWGQTEAPASTTLLGRHDMADPSLWSSIGRAIPGVEFSVLADGLVAEHPEPGQSGELVIRSATIASTLIGAEAEHADRLLPDGWWRTSDLGYLDDEGRLFITGRASETIITGGTNIQPVEIERALESHEAVQEAVVVGVPDAQWGETPAALLHATDLSAISGQALMTWLGPRLAGFKRPGYVFASIDPIPRASKEAKVARGEMKKLLRGWVEDPQSVPPNIVKVVDRRG